MRWYTTGKLSKGETSNHPFRWKAFAFFIAVLVRIMCRRNVRPTECCGRSHRLKSRRALSLLRLVSKGHDAEIHTWRHTRWNYRLATPRPDRLARPAPSSEDRSPASRF